MTCEKDLWENITEEDREAMRYGGCSPALSRPLQVALQSHVAHSLSYLAQRALGIRRERLVDDTVYGALPNVVGRPTWEVSLCGNVRLVTELLLSLDVDNAECRFLGKFEDVACLASQEANAAIVFALDQVLTTVIADKLDAVARASVRVFVFALEGKSFDNHVKADLWLVPVIMLLASRVCAARFMGLLTICRL